MRKTRMVIITGLTALSLAFAPAAHAASAGAIVFVGKAVLDAPICSPAKVVVPGCTQASPKTSVGFDFFAPNPHIGAGCVGAYVTAKKTPPAGAPNCSIFVEGSVDAIAAGVGPWCGASSGSGINGTITIAGKTWDVTDGGWIGVGGSLIVSGTIEKGNQTGSWAAVVNAAPDATKNSSCITGATQFIVAGAAAAATVIGSK